MSLVNEDKYAIQYYAGIGSREIPDDIKDMMTMYALKLRNDGLWLRSGGAKGADTAFEDGAGDMKQIFSANDATEEAIETAEDYHPAWNRCGDSIKKLHGRNAMIILGDDLCHTVEFTVCWTKNGKDIGGTGLGIRISEGYDAKVYNLFHARDIAELNERLGLA